MERTLTYTTDHFISPLPVNHFLKQKGFSSQNLVQLKKDPTAVQANGIPCFMNHILQPGDTLTLHIHEEHSSEKIPPVELPLDIIYEDEDLMVINKPAGMPIHPSMNNYYNSLANSLAYYFAQQNCPFVFRCINRLDRDTSGLTIVAKHYVSAGMLSTMIANKASSGITREYLAIVKGSVLPSGGTITAPFGRKKRAQPGLSHFRDRPHPSDTDSYEIPGLSPDRRLSVQSRYGIDTASGTACLEAVLCPSHHRGENAVHSTSAGGYGEGSGRYPMEHILNLLNLQAVMQIPMVQYYARSFFSAFSRIRHSPCSSRYLIFCSSAAYNAANSIAWMQALL